MKKRFPLFMALTAMIITLSIIVFPTSPFAAIPDGTYELKYEMKEAGSENTSIADGYFTKPAKLTVKNGVQTIQLTLTGSNYIDSLLAPSGPVEIISEDKVKNIRVVKFRVDGDLSKPLPMEMHIIVPDLYDMTHTARAVFDTSGLNQPVKEVIKKDPPKTETKPVEKDKKSESVETSKSTEKDKSTDLAEESSKQEVVEQVEEKENIVVDEEAEIEESNLEDQEEVHLDEEVAVTDEMTETEVKDAKEERGSTLPFWIALIFFVGCIAGFMFWKTNNK